MFLGGIQMQLFKVRIQMQMHLPFHGGISVRIHKLNIQKRIQMHLHLSAKNSTNTLANETIKLRPIPPHMSPTSQEMKIRLCRRT